MAQRIVIVTGCSTGVGLSTAVLLAKDADAKFKVYASMRNLSKKDQLVKRAGDCVDKTLFVIQMDICSDTSVDAAVKHVLEKEGRVDVLINNAAVGLMGVLEKQKWESIVNTYDTNVFGLLRTLRAVLPLMKKEKKGHIINVSSLGGLVGHPFNGVYISTKFAMEGLSESLAPELAMFNINISLVEPGGISTPFLDTVKGRDIDGMENSDDKTKELIGKIMEQFNAMTKMKSVMQTPDEIAEVIIKALKAEKPHFRYLTSKMNEEAMKKKFVDITGDAMIEASTRQCFGETTK